MATDLLAPADLAFLADLTAASIEAARVRPGEQPDPDRPGNRVGTVLIRPGGRACYPAVWVQDYALTLGTGLVTVEEMRDHLRLVCRAQHGAEPWHLASGAVVPPWAIPDHILFDGSPVYFPGTYSPGEDQGGERWGLRPPANNQYDAILIAHHLLAAGGDPAILREAINGLPVIERLRRAFAVPRTDPATGLVCTTDSDRQVGFIFCDSIYMTGHQLFASLLRWRTAHHLAGLEDALGETARAAAWRALADAIPPHLVPVFRDPAGSGWLLAATGIGRQPDVWGTIYALHLGLLAGEDASRARAAVVAALDAGTIALDGALRHVPTDRDASPTSAWERTHTAHQRYQNGAYWHTPTGWAMRALADHHPAWARRLGADMVAHLRAQDFRRGPAFGAPWECIGRTPDISQNAVFLGSVAVPYGVLR